MIRYAFLVLSFFVLITPARTQDLNETLSQVGEVYARAYVSPLAEILGAHMNTGLFHTAGASKKVFGMKNLKNVCNLYSGNRQKSEPWLPFLFLNKQS